MYKCSHFCNALCPVTNNFQPFGARKWPSSRTLQQQLRMRKKAITTKIQTNIPCCMPFSSSIKQANSHLSSLPQSPLHPELSRSSISETSLRTGLQLNRRYPFVSSQQLKERDYGHCRRTFYLSEAQVIFGILKSKACSQQSLSQNRNVPGQLTICSSKKPKKSST